MIYTCIDLHLKFETKPTKEVNLNKMIFKKWADNNLVMHSIKENRECSAAYSILNRFSITCLFLGDHWSMLTWVPAISIIFPSDNISSTTSSLSNIINPKPRERLVSWSRIIWCSSTFPYLEKKSLNSSDYLNRPELREREGGKRKILSKWDS